MIKERKNNFCITFTVRKGHYVYKQVQKQIHATKKKKGYLVVHYNDELSKESTVVIEVPRDQECIDELLKKEVEGKKKSGEKKEEEEKKADERKKKKEGEMEKKGEEGGKRGERGRERGGKGEREGDGEGEGEEENRAAAAGGLENLMDC